MYVLIVLWLCVFASFFALWVQTGCKFFHVNVVPQGIMASIDVPIGNTFHAMRRFGVHDAVTFWTPAILSKDCHSQPKLEGGNELWVRHPLIKSFARHGLQPCAGMRGSNCSQPSLVKLVAGSNEVAYDGVLDFLRQLSLGQR